MIGHQHVGVNRAAQFTGKRFQVMKIERVILILVEAGAAVIAPLDEVKR